MRNNMADHIREIPVESPKNQTANVSIFGLRRQQKTIAKRNIVWIDLPTGKTCLRESNDGMTQ